MERRHCARKVLNLKAELVAGSKRYSAFIKNLTANGAYIESVPSSLPLEVSPGARVELSLKLPTGKMLSIPGVVKWSSAEAKALTNCVNCVGIEITQQSSGLREFLKTIA